MNKLFLTIILIMSVLLIASCGGATESTTATTGLTTTTPTMTTTTQTTTTTPTTTIPDVSGGAPSAAELAEQGFISPELPRITAEKLKQLMDQGESFILVDVRDGYQYIFKHLPQAISLPLNTGDAQIAGFLALPKDELIFIY
jgi:ABC-type Fe3+-hydroxamate transport system substrate-binding protein